MSDVYRFNNKYVVLKRDDINRHLSEDEQACLAEIENIISRQRRGEGKGDNSYLVINTDESYAPEVAAIMVAHGHCAGPDDEGDLITVPKEVPAHA